MVPNTERVRDDSRFATCRTAQPQAALQNLFDLLEVFFHGVGHILTPGPINRKESGPNLKSFSLRNLCDLCGLGGESANKIK